MKRSTLLVCLLLRSVCAASVDCPATVEDIDGKTGIAWNDRTVSLLPTRESVRFPQTICGVLVGPRQSFFPWSADGSVHMAVGDQALTLGQLAGSGESLLCARADRPDHLILGVQEQGEGFVLKLLSVPEERGSRSHRIQRTDDAVRACDIAPNGCGALLQLRSGALVLTTFPDGRLLPLATLHQPARFWLHRGCAHFDVLGEQVVERCDIAASGATECRPIAARAATAPQRGIDGAFERFAEP